MLRKTAGLGLALALSIVALSCGGGDNHEDFTSGPGGKTTTVYLNMGTVAGVYGFDVTLNYNSARVTPVSPITAAAFASGIAATGSTCEVTQVGTGLRLACIRGTGMAGPGQVATFNFNNIGSAPKDTDFVPTCSFFDGNGAKVTVTCSSAIAP